MMIKYNSICTLAGAPDPSVLGSDCCVLARACSKHVYRIARNIIGGN